MEKEKKKKIYGIYLMSPKADTKQDVQEHHRKNNEATIIKTTQDSTIERTFHILDTYKVTIGCKHNYKGFVRVCMICTDELVLA